MAGASPRSLSTAGLLCLLLVVPMAAASTQFKVGGDMGWVVPGPNAESYDHWAERNRFQIGDSLLFVYPEGKDSVLQVNKEDYDSCNTANPITKFADGNTVFSFDRSGPFFFISGVPDNCNNNEKLVVVVLADRSNRSSGSNQTTSAPPPSPAPASPPSSAPAPPSPAPASPPSSPPAPPSPPPEASAAAPPPPASIEIVPSPSPPQGGVPTSPPPAPNAAPSRAMGMVGSAGALLGSLAFFVL